VAEPSPTPTPPLRGPITLAFAGDVHVMGAIRQRFGSDGVLAAGDPLFGDVGPLLRGADLAVVNLETAVTDRGTAADKEYVFRAPAGVFPALVRAGVDVASLANNHGMDYGQVGLADTLAAARSARFRGLVGAGVDDTAAFTPYLATVKGWRVAVLGATHVLDTKVATAWTARPGHPGLASAYRLDRLVQAVREARSRADTVVVYLHWGTEMHACPTASQKALAQALVDAGADVVVGSHAHVLLGDGRLGAAYVGYGLGNFLFYANGSGPNTQSEVLTLTVRGRHVVRADHHPVRVGGGRVHLVTGAAADTARARIAGLRGCTGLSLG
jgi:poly-gamma-glutamate synthesis protein (capsule biosynthesis protein)